MNELSYLSLETMKQWVSQNKEKWLDEFFTFLRFPSISSEIQYKQSVLDCSQWLKAYLKNLGFQVEMWSTTGYPVIFAECHVDVTKPTLLIYHHYDVQPADPIDKWETSPFEPSIKNGNVYARGAQDNKGQCIYVLQALKLLKEKLKKFPINIKLCIEGEEEIGSPGLSQILVDKKEKLKADYLAIVDLGLKKANSPALTLGIRGILTLDVEVKGSNLDLHSGSHGGIVYNPIHALVSLLAKLRDEKGRITIPGFYNDIAEVSTSEKENLCFEFNTDEYKKQTGALPIGGENEYSVLERAWIRPTLEINGIHGGYTGSGFKTVIPAKAHAKISCRLVPHQDPQTIATSIAKFLKENVPSGLEVNIDIHSGQGKAVRISPHAKIVKNFAQAFEEVFGSPCEFIFEGASIPIVAKLSEATNGETILLGLGLLTDQIHAPNEHFGLERIEKGILVMARAIELLSK